MREEAERRWEVHGKANARRGTGWGAGSGYAPHKVGCWFVLATVRAALGRRASRNLARAQTASGRCAPDVVAGLFVETVAEVYPNHGELGP